MDSRKNVNNACYNLFEKKQSGSGGENDEDAMVYTQNQCYYNSLLLSN